MKISEAPVYMPVFPAASTCRASSQQVHEDRAQLERSQENLTRNKENYAQAVRDANTQDKNNLKLVIQAGSGTQQTTTPTTSVVDLGTPVVSTPTVNANGQTTGSVVSTTA